MTCENKLDLINEVIKDYVMKNLYLLSLLANPNYDKDTFIALSIDATNELKSDIRYILDESD